tara:strand:+ start:294 stop:1508 length:1215 start_codon:yes stop_codon:yes gene_type:complete
MSEINTNEPVKQEGNFSLKGKSKKPKQLSKQSDEITKVSIKEPLIDLQPDVTKVVISKDELKQEADAIQEQSTEESVLHTEQPKVGLQEVGQGDSEPVGDVKENLPLQEITEEVKQVVQEAKEAVRDEKILGKPLPENIEKLVNFMEDTGGTVEDYVRLNADYSSIDDKTLLKEYYKKTKPYLESDDVSLLLEDYDYDEDLDEERDIRKKKIAFKEEVAKAKNFLEETKSKYYDEIKLRPGVTQEQQKAMDFFNRYNEDQETANRQHEDFKSQTDDYFNNEFKGFEFDVSGKKFRYGVQNPSKVAEDQSNINNFVGKFLNKEGKVTDAKGYHKALFMASNADTIINHFYEQGKSDATKDIIGKSKNPSTQPRQAQEGEFINGLKVRSISGQDSSRLKIKTKKFN